MSLFIFWLRQLFLLNFTHFILQNPLNSFITNKNFITPLNPEDFYLQNLYEKVHNTSKSRVLNQEYLKTYNKEKYEDLRGFSVIVNLTDFVKEPLKSIMTDLAKSEPDQKVNKPQNYHQTAYVFTASGKADLEKKLTPEFVAKCKLALERALKNFSEFTVEFKGLSCTPNAVIANGYSHGALAELKKRIDTELVNLGMPLTKNQSPFNHITLMRLTSPLENPEKFIKTIDKNHSAFLGEAKVNSFQLVVNDPYNEPEHSKVLASYNF